MPLGVAWLVAVVGGPVTAVALRVRRNHSQRRAVLGGLATGGVALLFLLLLRRRGRRLGSRRVEGAAADGRRHGG